MERAPLGGRRAVTPSLRQEVRFLIAPSRPPSGGPRTAPVRRRLGRVEATAFGHAEFENRRTRSRAADLCRRAAVGHALGSSKVERSPETREVSVRSRPRALVPAPRWRRRLQPAGRSVRLAPGTSRVRGLGRTHARALCSRCSMEGHRSTKPAHAGSSPAESATHDECNARMMELEDIPASEADAPRGAWGFDSLSGHLFSTTRHEPERGAHIPRARKRGGSCRPWS